MGRKSSYTPDRIERLIQALRLGATHRLACNYAGINERTFYRWMADAREKGSRSRYKELPGLVAEAEGKATVGWLAAIEKAAKDGDWRAAAWKLERRHPEEYGKQVIDFNGRTSVEVKVPDEARALLREQLRSLPTEQLEALEERDGDDG